VRTVQGMKRGDPTDPATYIGPLTRAPQIAVLELQGATLPDGEEADALPVLTDAVRKALLDEAGARYRVMTRESIREQIPADRLASLEAALATLLEDRKADRKLIEQLGALAATSIGHAGKMLSTFARSPEAKAYRDARIQEGKDRRAIERANRILPLLDNTNGNGGRQ
jgi:hypothetical protein